MSALWNRQPKRQVPEPVAPPQHGSPNPMFSEPSELQAFRWRIVGITAGILAVVALGYAVYGPWFAVRTVTVTGTRELNPASVKEVTMTELERWRWGIIPQKNLWLLSRKHLSVFLQNKIRERLSIEEVNVIKRNRHDLEIAIVERTPLAVWKTDQGQATIDRGGVIINSIAVGSSSLPIILDEGNKPWKIDQQVLTEPVMKGFLTLHQTFTALAFAVESYRIPVPTCPSIVVEPEISNTNQANTNSEVDEVNVNGQTTTRNTNEDFDEVNTNTQGPTVVQTDCDKTALAKASQEIHVKLKDGPLVLFDRHQDLQLAVETVKRLLAEQANAGATYIDIRFQERVYIK